MTSFQKDVIRKPIRAKLFGGAACTAAIIVFIPSAAVGLRFKTAKNLHKTTVQQAFIAKSKWYCIFVNM
jgi:hypothetical protein